MTSTGKPCTCDPTVDRTGPLAGSYTVGCEHHMQLQLDRGPAAVRKGATAVTVTYFHAQIKVSKPVLQDGNVWSEEHWVECNHNHATPEAAERCAAKLNWKDQIR